MNCFQARQPREISNVLDRLNLIVAKVEDAQGMKYASVVLVLPYSVTIDA